MVLLDAYVVGYGVVSAGLICVYAAAKLYLRGAMIADDVVRVSARGGVA